MTPYSVFVSHSMKQEDLAIVYETERDARSRGISCYIAERDWQFGKSLPAKIDTAIRASDCVVAFLTQGGAHSAWVNQEIGHAVGCKKPRILVVKKDCRSKASMSATNTYRSIERILGTR